MGSIPDERGRFLSAFAGGLTVAFAVGAAHGQAKPADSAETGRPAMREPQGVPAERPAEELPSRSSESKRSEGMEAKRPPPVNEDPLPRQAPLAEGTERAAPDYDGRGGDPVGVGDVALWIPRVLASPLYLVSEYVVRRPLGWLVTKAEQEELPALLVDIFTFGPSSEAGIIPTTLIDFGFKPSVGLYFFWNDWVADDSDLRVRGATWGPDWITASISNRTRFWGDHEFSQRAGILRRPDWIFHGLGPDTTGERTRYSETRADAALEYAAQLWRTSSATAFVGIRAAEFDGDMGCCSDPSLNQAVVDGRFGEPPGLGEGYQVLRSGFSLALDSRRRRSLDEPREGSDYVSPPGGGVRLALRGEHAGGLNRTRPTPDRDLERYDWVKYGATLGGFVDVDGQQRVLGLSLIADFADPLRSDGQIPFAEQVGLGGERPMRGFLEGRLLDRSAVVAQLEYRWPVWVWLDGTFHYAVGNVFGRHLGGFEADLLRQSFGIGLRANNARDHAFEILSAFGTETFEQGGRVDTFRFVLGASSGF